MQEITTYKYGFYFKGVPYGWKNKKLYRLPHVKNKRSYGIKEITFYCFKTTLVCNIQKQKLTINRLKKLTAIVNFENIEIISSDCPF